MSVTDPFSKIFLAIMDRLEKEVTAIKHIDQDMGQLQGNSTRASVGFPNILVDFTGWTFSNIGDNVQLAQGKVVVSLGWAQYTPSSNHMEPAYREEALKIFAIERDVNKVLHGWSPGDEFGYLTRSNIDTRNLIAGVRQRPLSYDLEFEDYSARPEKTTANLPNSMELDAPEVK